MDVKEMKLYEIRLREKGARYLGGQDFDTLHVVTDSAAAAVRFSDEWMAQYPDEYEFISIAQQHSVFVPG